MIKLMIVDDDEVICNGLAACVDWESHDIRVSDTAFDGEMALEKVRANRPDVMLVDINMPFMDGLELAFAVRQESAHIKIILLTAYKEFQYAKRAIELQVFSYISKPFRNQEVLEAVQKAGEAVLAERRYRHEIEENGEIIRQKYLSQIVTGRTSSPEKIRWCGLAPAGVSYAVGILLTSYIYPDSAGDSLHEMLLISEVSQRLFLDEVRRVLAGRPGILFYPKGEWVVLLFSGRRDELVKRDAAEILGALGSHYGHYASMGVGRSYEGTEQLPDTYDEAKTALDYRNHFGNNSVIHIDDIADPSAENQLNLPVYRRRILDFVRDGDIAQAQQTARGLFDKIRQTRHASHPTVSFLALELLVASYKATRDEETLSRFVEECLPGFSPGRCAGIDDLQAVVERGLGHLLEDGSHTGYNELERLMERVIAYIEENYANPELSLKMAAAHVHISTSYLCILFRQIRQTNYVNYLNGVRMENAKRLLRTSGIKTYEVAYRVGYNSAQYFASSFKKYTGKTPSEYRGEARGL